MRIVIEIRKPALIFPALVVFSMTACQRDKEIKVYRVAKDVPQAEIHAHDPHDPHAGMPGMMPGSMDGDPHAGIPGMGGADGDPHAGLAPGQMAAIGSRPMVHVHDTPPSEWKRREPSALRQLSYQLDGEEGVSADISLIILRGAAGRDLDNINRWRDEQGLEAIDRQALAQYSQTFTTPAGSAVAVDIEGLPAGADPLNNGRLVGVIATRGNDAWFFRMRGNAELTAAHKESFISWVKSVQPGEESAPDAAQAAAGGPDAAEPPCCPTDDTGAAHADHTPAVAAPAGDAPVVWRTPAGWVQDPSAGSMRYATYRINRPDGSKGEMAVTHFPGDVGGDLANVNRWRSQIGLPQVTAEELDGLMTSIAAGPKTLSLVDLVKDDTRVVTAWTRHGAETWFFKFSGPTELVAAEMENFTALMQSLRFQTSE